MALPSPLLPPTLPMKPPLEKKTPTHLHSPTTGIETATMTAVYKKCVSSQFPPLTTELDRPPSCCATACRIFVFFGSKSERHVSYLAIELVRG